MAEARPGPDPEEATWEAATDKKMRRQLKFLELASIPSEQAGAPAETYEDSGLLALEPWQTYELFRKTYIGAYLPEPDELVMNVCINGLAGPGYYEPVATERPNKAYIRRTIIPGNPFTDVNRQLGVVLQFDTSNSTRLVTAEAECGIALFETGFKVYQRARILVNHAPFAMQPTALYPCRVCVVDEFLSNIQGLVGVPPKLTTLKKMPRPRAPNDGTMPLHDDTPPPTDDD